MRYLILFVIFLNLEENECACTFPSFFTGTWVSSVDDTWIVNSTVIQNYRARSSTTGKDLNNGISHLDMACYENQGNNLYAIKSPQVELFNNVFLHMYTCLDIREISSTKMVYYKATVRDLSGYKFTVNSNYTEICNDAAYETSYGYHVALKSGSESQGTITCPYSVFGSYTYDTCAFAPSNTSVDVCDSRTQFIYNYTLCNTTQMFSMEGTLNCVYFVESGTTTYLTLYNADSTTPDAATYYQYTCLAIESSSNTVYLTSNPEQCNTNQNGTAIASPGVAMVLTPYYLCPITTTTVLTTTTVSTTSTTDWLPIILGIVGGLVLLALIAIIICCCCCCKRCKKKQKDEENPDDSGNESEKEESEPSESRRSSKSDASEGDRESMDSGISEPPVTGRTDSKGQNEEEENELVIKTVGEKDFDDKSSRPRSGQSRTSDLPPSTLPPDEDYPITDRSEEEEQKDMDDESIKEDGVNEDKVNEDEGPKQEEEKGDEEKSEQESENETEKEEEENVIEEDEENDEETDSETKAESTHEESEHEQEQVEQEQVQQEQVDQKPEEQQEEKEQEQDNSGEDDEEEGSEETDENRSERGSVKGVVVLNGEDNKQDEQKQNTEDPYHKDDTKEDRRDGPESSDEETRQYRQIGGKKGKEFSPAGPLTTVLVTRHDEEKKRNKIRNKNEKQRMTKLAKQKSRRIGGKGKEEDGDEMMSSDDEARQWGERGAPFMEQYRNKKRIEYILDEQHYWSDPEADKELYGVDDNMSSVFNSDLSLNKDSDSEYEDKIGPDGTVILVKKYKLRRHGPDSDTSSIISGADSEYLRKRKLQQAKSLESLASVEDPDNIDAHKSKRKLNEHTLKQHDADNLDKTGTKTNINGENINQDMEHSKENNGKFNKEVSNTRFSKTKVIRVKERDENSGENVNVTIGNDIEGREGRRYMNGDNGDMLSEFCDTDMDKLSDRDSGMDDEDEAVDVILNSQQQQMIVNMLFDEDMNLRPEFDRDEHGRIIRRLDGTVIYDPNTGRFTFRKRLGRLFNVPRLKRNDKGRPTGGYINDAYGPQHDDTRHSVSSGKKSRMTSSKSGRTGARTATDSPILDSKKYRGDGRNVGFDVPEDDLESLQSDQLAFNKRGRRDITSAIRRKLNKRLFKKKKGRSAPGTPGSLPDLQVRRAWSGGDLKEQANNDSLAAPGGVSPLVGRGGRSTAYGQGTPLALRRMPSGNDPEKWQNYRDGLQSDRRILEKLNAGGSDRPFAPKDAFVDVDGEDNKGMPELQDDDNQHFHHHGEGPHGHFHRSLTYVNEDGKLVIRERNCPDLKKSKTPLFTIIRRPGDMEKEEQERGSEKAIERNAKSAPLQMQDMNEEGSQVDLRYGNRFHSENSMFGRSMDGSMMTSIDDNRLRRLLEELYKDKKYLDNYVETTEPKSEAIIHSKGLAEHGRDYLLERAGYWEQRGPLPPRPPMTDIGWKVKRQQTMWESRQTSERGSTMMTTTPDMTTHNMPGVIESPRESRNSDENVIENRENSTSNVNNESTA